MPIDVTVAGDAPGGPRPLAAYLAAVAAAERPAPDLVVVGVRPAGGGTGAPAAPGAVPGPGVPELGDFLSVPAADLIARHDMTGAAGEGAQAVLAVGPATVTALFLGLGDGSPGALARAGAAVGRRVAGGRTAVCAAVAGEPAAAVRAFAEGLLLGSYTFGMKSAGRNAPRSREATESLAAGEPGEDNGEDARPAGQALLLITGPAGLGPALDAAAAVAGAVALARDLANTPSSVKSPGWLADQATSVAAASGLTVRVRAQGELAAGGFGGLLAVGSGSRRPPCLIELSYRPEGATTHVVLVGKGITFDSGGLSLKPNDGMRWMKTDMAGGAAVIAVMSVLARLGISVRVTGLVAAAENMPSGSAMRPGDVIRHYGGRTAEVLNTDAEGRLVLADALAYADAELQPDVLIDLATLTGAARVALSSARAALFATDDALAVALLAAGETSRDRLWRLPLYDDYRAGLDSPVADLANVASGSRAQRPGSIDAALFLREFTGGRPWAHLDIAGAARAMSEDGENTKGATGFGTRLMLHWLAGAGQPMTQQPERAAR